MNVLANFLLCKIQQKLNPHFQGGKVAERKISFSERCTGEEFAELFPLAVFTDEKKRKTPIKFTSSRKISEVQFSNVNQLTYLFGEGWDLVYNKTSVGFCCPILTFRLRECKVISNKASLTDDIGAEEVENLGTNTYTSISVSFFRSAESRWSTKKNEVTGTYEESDYLRQVRIKQKMSKKLAKRRVLNYKK